MNGSLKVAVWGIAAVVSLGPAAGSGAAATSGRESGASASSFEYTVKTREDLIARRSAFDPSDGLQRSELRLLAMDPNGAANPGR